MRVGGVVADREGRDPQGRLAEPALPPAFREVGQVAVRSAPLSPGLRGNAVGRPRPLRARRGCAAERDEA